MKRVESHLPDRNQAEKNLIRSQVASCHLKTRPKPYLAGVAGFGSTVALGPGTRKSLPLKGHFTVSPGAMPFTSTNWCFAANGLLTKPGRPGTQVPVGMASSFGRGGSSAGAEGFGAGLGFAGGASATLGSGAGITVRGAAGDGFTEPFSGLPAASAGFGTSLRCATEGAEGLAGAGRVSAAFGFGGATATSFLGKGGSVRTGRGAAGAETRGEGATAARGATAATGAGLAGAAADRAERGGSPVRKYEVVAQLAPLPIGARLCGRRSRRLIAGKGAEGARVVAAADALA